MRGLGHQGWRRRVACARFGACAAVFSVLAPTHAGCPSGPPIEHYVNADLPSDRRPFDLQFRRIDFIPCAGGGYHHTSTPLERLPTDPTGSVWLRTDPLDSIGENDSVAVAFPPGVAFPFFGKSYTAFHVNSTGNVTFIVGDTVSTLTLERHARLPRLSALYTPLNPERSGAIGWRALHDRVVVTWEHIARPFRVVGNTVQVEMHFDGRITFAYLDVPGLYDIYVGLSDGATEPEDYAHVDFSTSSHAPPRPPIAIGRTYDVPANEPAEIELVGSLRGEHGTADFTVVSLPSRGTLRDPIAGVQIAPDSLPYTLLSGGNVVEYQPSLNCVGDDGFRFVVNDGAASAHAGVAIVVNALEAVYEQAFDDATPPALWNGFVPGRWEHGQPTGGGSPYVDPTSGFTGVNVVGYNLAGNYPANMQPEHVTLGPIDCSEHAEVLLEFRRWITINTSLDTAAIAVSADLDGPWTPVWSRSSTRVDRTWRRLTYDISDVADLQPSVYIRWTMGPTDSSAHGAGWNIDDVRVLGRRPSPRCPGDANGDGVVDFADLSIVLRHVGAMGHGVPGDLTCAGEVGSDAFAMVLSHYGATCD